MEKKSKLDFPNLSMAFTYEMQKKIVNEANKIEDLKQVTLQLLDLYYQTKIFVVKNFKDYEM
jgi:hypothetical protein